MHIAVGYEKTADYEKAKDSNTSYREGAYAADDLQWLGIAQP